MKIESTGGFVPFKIEIETKEDYDLLLSVLNSAEVDIERRNYFLGSMKETVGDITTIKHYFPKELELIEQLRRCGAK